MRIAFELYDMKLVLKIILNCSQLVLILRILKERAMSKSFAWMWMLSKSIHTLVQRMKR